MLKICVATGNNKEAGDILPSDDNLVPSFIYLPGETLANLYYYDYEAIYDEIEKEAGNKVTDEPLNNLALQFIKAYDICGDKQLLETAKHILLRILSAFPDAVHCLMNMWQIEYREFGALSSESKGSARKLLTKIDRGIEDNDDYYRSIYFCLLVMLDEKESAREFFCAQTEKLRDEIIQWPIYTLYKAQHNKEML